MLSSQVPAVTRCKSWSFRRLHPSQWKPSKSSLTESSTTTTRGNSRASGWCRSALKWISIRFIIWVDVNNPLRTVSVCPWWNLSHSPTGWILQARPSPRRPRSSFDWPKPTPGASGLWTRSTTCSWRAWMWWKVPWDSVCCRRASKSSTASTHPCSQSRCVCFVVFDICRLQFLILMFCSWWQIPAHTQMHMIKLIKIIAPVRRCKTLAIKLLLMPALISVKRHRCQ